MYHNVESSILSLSSDYFHQSNKNNTFRFWERERERERDGEGRAVGETISDELVRQFRTQDIQELSNVHYLWRSLKRSINSHWFIGSASLCYVYLNNIQNHSPYLTANTLHLHYKYQLVNAV